MADLEDPNEDLIDGIEKVMEGLEGENFGFAFERI